MDLFCKLCLLFAFSIPVHTQYLKVLETAFQIYDVVDAFLPDDPKPVTAAEVESIMNVLSEEIHASEINILRNIMLQSRLDRLDDTVIQIRSSLQDLHNYLNASSSTRESFMSVFITNYENGEISLIRFLPTLLTYQSPGRQDTLLSLLADDTRCNLTAIYGFKTFYYKLISSGIGINVAYNVLKFQMSKDEAVKEWTKTADEIEVKFETVENHCHSLFTTYANQDLSEAISAHELHIKNNAWKPWKRNDAFFSKLYGTHQFVYFEYEDDTVIWQKSDTNDKVAVFYQSDLYENRLPSNILTDSTESFRSSITDEDDDSAAKHVAEAVQNMLKQDDYIIEALVVLFDDGYSEEVIDPDSPVVKATIADVKLSYCYESGAGCVFDLYNTRTKTASGSFKIYVYAHYPNATMQHSEHHIGAANSLANISFVLFFATISITTVNTR